MTTQFTKKFTRYLRNTRAVSALEYALLLGIVAVGIAVAIGTLSTSIDQAIGKSKTAVDSKVKAKIK